MDGKSGGEVEAAELAGLPHRVPARPLRPHDPRKVGDYQLIGRLGEGGMGRVYLARSGAGRLVAVKVIRDALAEDSDFLRRFRGEVARARQVPPFCTAEVLDADPDHDPPYLVVEFVDGPTLADVVERDGPLTPANLHGLAVGMAAALTAIHGAGVIHRDLKPSNVLLAPGTPKVIDFGISRPVDGTMTNSTGNFVLGTVSYMSPERFGADASRTLSPAADIFAWGAVVTFAGTGKVPFPADSLAEIAMRIMTDPPELDGLTGTLRDLVERALAKEPAQRPTARELLEQLTTAVPAGSQAPTLRDIPRQAGAATPPEPPARRRSRLATVSAAVAAVLALGATLGVATGVIPVPHLGGRGQAESSLYPSPPAPSVPAGFHLVAADPLAAPRSGWQPVSDPKHKATCEVGTGLEVTLAVRGPYRCPGPDALAERLDGNVAVFVTVELRTPGSCAGIWFHFYNLSGYLLQVCQDGMHLLIHGRPTDVDVERLDDFGPGLPVGQASRIGVTMHGDQLRFYRDGRMVRDYTASTEYVPPGHVVLGAYIGGTPGKPPYRVRFTDVEIWSDNT